MDHKRLIRLPEVIRRVGLKKSSIYAYVHRGWFPKPVPLGVRSVAWLEQDVDSWIANRVAVSSDQIGVR